MHITVSCGPSGYQAINPEVRAQRQDSKEGTCLASDLLGFHPRPHPWYILEVRKMLNPYGVHLGVTIQTHFGRKVRKGSEPVPLSGGYTFEGPSYREERVFPPLVI